MKGLRAFGQQGRHGIGLAAKAGWNWCGRHEVVALDGFVCCSAETCGCDRSFAGQKSRMATTLAIVSELADSERTKATDALEPLLKDLARGIVVQARCKGEEWVLQPVTELSIGTAALRFQSGINTWCGEIFIVFQQEPIEGEEPYTKAVAVSECEWVARDHALDTVEALLKEYQKLAPEDKLVVERGSNTGDKHPSCEEWMVIGADSKVNAYVWVQKLSWLLRPLDLNLAI